MTSDVCVDIRVILCGSVSLLRRYGQMTKDNHEFTDRSKIRRQCICEMLCDDQSQEQVVLESGCKADPRHLGSLKWYRRR